MIVFTNRKRQPAGTDAFVSPFYFFSIKGLKNARLFVFTAIVLMQGFLFSLPVCAQYESLLHKSYGKNVLGVHSMYNDLIQIKDSTLQLKRAEEIKDFARRNKDRALELNVDFFLVFWSTFYQHQPKDVSLKRLKNQLKLVTTENLAFLRPRSLRALAEFYWKIEKNYELAFEQYLLLDKELITIQADEYPEMARDLMQIGEAYFFFQDYTLAKKYFKRAVALPENAFNTMVINAARNNLGLCSLNGILNCPTRHLWVLANGIISIPVILPLILKRPSWYQQKQGLKGIVVF